MLRSLVAIAVIATSFLLWGAPVYAQDANIQGGLCAGANFDIQPGAANTASCANNGDAVEKINSLVTQFINIMSAIVGIVAVIMIIVGGLRYITSGGNDSSVTSAKNTILYAIIGLIVVALSQLIVRFVLSKVSST